jgi:hypothetical protein
MVKWVRPHPCIHAEGPGFDPRTLRGYYRVTKARSTTSLLRGEGLRGHRWFSGRMLAYHVSIYIFLIFSMSEAFN